MAEVVSKSFFCVWNNPEKIITYEHLPNGEIATDQSGAKKILSEEPTYLDGMTPEEICKNIIKQWCDSDNGHRTGAVAYCISKTGLKHCHMVLESDKAMRFTALKKVFPKMHIEVTKGNKEQAEDYINKRGKYAEKGEEVLHIEQVGEIQGRQGQRNDISVIPELIKNGMTPSEIMDLNFSYRKYEKYIKDEFYSQRAKITPPLRNVNVEYIVGDTGTGKTYKYVELCEEFKEENIYPITDYQNGTFDKYNGEPILFMNEFRGQIPYSTLLSMLEGYKMQVHSRYTNALMLWNSVYITSPLFPQDLYTNLAKEDKITQLLRRIKTLTYCYKVETADKIQYNKIIFPFDMMKSKDTYLYEIDRIKKVRATGNDTEISKLADLITYTFTSNEILK